MHFVYLVTVLLWLECILQNLDYFEAVVDTRNFSFLQVKKKKKKELHFSNPELRAIVQGPWWNCFAAINGSLDNSPSMKRRQLQPSFGASETPPLKHRILGYFEQYASTDSCILRTRTVQFLWATPMASKYSIVSKNVVKFDCFLKSPFFFLIIKMSQVSWVLFFVVVLFWCHSVSGSAWLNLKL